MRVLVSEAENAGPKSQELKNLVTRTVRAVLETEGAPDNSEVSVVLAGDDLLRDLNRRYRGIDEPTDVLSFSQEEGFALGPGPTGEALVLGDVVVSLERAGVQASERGYPLERELAFLVAHGVFHLLGYDHATSEDEHRMMTRTEQILRTLWPGSK